MENIFKHQIFFNVVPILFLFHQINSSLDFELIELNSRVIAIHAASRDQLSQILASGGAASPLKRLFTPYYGVQAGRMGCVLACGDKAVMATVLMCHNIRIHPLFCHTYCNKSQFN